MSDSHETRPGIRGRALPQPNVTAVFRSGLVAAIRRSRRVASVLAVVASVTGFVAHGAEPTPAPPSSSEDALSAAKRQLDGLKTETGVQPVGGSTSAALPQLVVPDMHPAPAVAVPAAPLKDANRPEKRSANWLVDAMAERDGRDQDRGRDSRDGRKGSDATALRANESARAGSAFGTTDPSGEGDEPGAAAERSRAAGDNAAAAGTKERAATNPLTPYLSQWLTPQDYSVLRRSLETTRDRDLPSAGPSTAAPGTLTAPEEALAGLGIEAIAAPKPAWTPPAQPADNPYLAALAPPPSAIATPPPAAPSFTPAPASPAFAPPPEMPQAKPTIPDFAKRAEDDRYFKPLKRF